MLIFLLLESNALHVVISVSIFRFCDGVPRPQAHTVHPSFMHPLRILKGSSSSGCRPPVDKTVGLCKVNFRDRKQSYMTCLRKRLQWAKVMNLQKFFFSCQPMKGDSSRADPEGQTPLAPEKSPKIGFLSILVRIPLKSQAFDVRPSAARQRYAI